MYTRCRFIHPHNRHEHASAANRYLHFVGTSLAVMQLLRDPRLLLAGLLAVGPYPYVVGPHTRHTGRMHVYSTFIPSPGSVNG